MASLLEKFKAQAKAQAEKERQKIENHKSYKSENIEHLFGRSLENKPEVTIEKDQAIVTKACTEASKLVQYFKAKDYIANDTVTYNIPLKTGFTVVCQTTNFTIQSKALGEFLIDISIPLNIDGRTRLWTTDKVGKKVWTTTNTIIHSSVDKVKLFYYLSKQYSLLTSEEIVAIEYDILDTIS